MYLGIDIGTQSVKALCFDPTAKRVAAVASAPLSLISRDDGTREQDAAWWVSALRSCLSSIDHDIRECVRAIGVSGQQHGFVALDDKGQVLAPVKLWCDTVTSPQCDTIMTVFGGVDRCIAEVGNPILPGYTASKIRWLREFYPELYACLHTILLPHDYINFYLTGERAMERGDASGTGLLDIRKGDWHPGMVAALDSERDLSPCLPPILAAGQVVGHLLPDVARELGLRPGIAVSCGGGDNMMAAIGTGNVAVGRLTVSLGTSGTLFAYASQPVIDPTATLAAFCDSTGGWLPLLCTMNCTVATELTRDVLMFPLDDLEHCVQASTPGAGGVITLPFFQGERTPNLPRGQGCILGLNHNNYTRENLLRSAMESAVYGLRTGLEVFRQQGCHVADVRVTGGGAKSRQWRQMVADIFNLPVTKQRVDEGAALGAALQACWVDNPGVALKGLVDELLELDEAACCEPVDAHVSDYDVHYGRYQQYLAALTPIYE